MNFKRHKPKRQRAGCECNGKIYKRYKRRGRMRQEWKLTREYLHETVVSRS